uniref:Probable 3-hydroxyisobutyrate dehydrogenase-like 1, mitochondrial n=1 Tax=Elaeis guineensis var. tenera TaxID=51953 RepID=A0A6I9QYI5_ELAGV|nr:probable 3-hydroxyisobutyrate dehydrogenase-like 1, mitochondrial [Elaeis guineensis]XP_029120313.1 probable 3-hydroxyisobutyrate dehydrogenase-like 1, mitochondrial [Elaeis guineensis]XP_029120317.1 probable 3-hydroxyisobutyrate dehydrogenase-like 1, mitochondrial [Elaeis guineensis]
MPPRLPSLLRRSHQLYLLGRRLAVHPFSPMSTVSSDRPITPATTRVGWIGTGVMGQSMAAHLLSAGYSLNVFNRTASKAQPLVDRGARLADSPLAVARASDVVFFIVGYPADVRRVALDPATGVLPGLSPGSVLVDMTTSDPALAAEIASAAASAGCAAVDAPVSGGDRGARAGTLSIFAGGEEAVVRRLEPLFRCMGTVRYMGGPGAGQRAKLGNQIAIASTMVGLVEGMVFAHKAGLDVSKWLEAISTGAAGSKSLEFYGKRILERDMEAGFYVHHFVKDLGICLMECQSMGLALPGLALAQQLYVSLMAHGEGGLGAQALILSIERLNDTCLKGGSASG